MRSQKKNTIYHYQSKTKTSSSSSSTIKICIWKKTTQNHKNFPRTVRHFGVVSFANKSHPRKEREENTPFPTPQPLNEHTHIPPLRGHLLQYEPHELTWKRGPSDTRPFSKEGIFLIDFLTCGEKRPSCVGAAFFSYPLCICMDLGRGFSTISVWRYILRFVIEILYESITVEIKRYK